MTQTPIHLPAFVNYECQTCAWCCKQYNITFSSDEYRRLSKHDWRALVPSFAEKQWCAPWRNPRSPNSYRLRATPEGACVFLSPDDKCLIHAHVGELGKPIACPVYPFAFAHTPTGIYVGCRFACRAIADGLGESISRRKHSIRKQLRLVEKSGQIGSDSRRKLQKVPVLRDTSARDTEHDGHVWPSSAGLGLQAGLVAEGLQNGIPVRVLAFVTENVTLRQATILCELSRLPAESVGLVRVVIDSVERSFSDEEQAGSVSSSVQRGEPFDSLRSLMASGRLTGGANSVF